MMQAVATCGIKLSSCVQFIMFILQWCFSPNPFLFDSINLSTYCMSLTGYNPKDLPKKFQYSLTTLTTQYLAIEPMLIVTFL